jgi:hypothetical protein
MQRVVVLALIVALAACGKKDSSSSSAPAAGSQASPAPQEPTAFKVLGGTGDLEVLAGPGTPGLRVEYVVRSKHGTFALPFGTTAVPDVEQIPYKAPPGVEVPADANPVADTVTFKEGTNEFFTLYRVTAKIPADQRRATLEGARDLSMSGMGMTLGPQSDVKLGACEGIRYDGHGTLHSTEMSTRMWVLLCPDDQMISMLFAGPAPEFQIDRRNSTVSDFEAPAKPRTLAK